MSNAYTVSYDSKGKVWYCHMRGFPYIPVCGSFCEKKSEAMQYAKRNNGLPNKCEEIEKRRYEAWRKEMET